MRRREFFTVLGAAIATWLFAATTRGAAEDFMTPRGVPAEAFPNPDRPVADIVGQRARNDYRSLVALRLSGSLPQRPKFSLHRG